MKGQQLRYGVADLYRRAEVSHRANARYLEALASVTGRTPLHQEALGVCQAMIVEHHRYRALNPWSLEDGKLLELINRGEFKLHGLRNRDLRVLFFAPTKDKKLQRRQAAAITRRIALLRAHRLLRKAGATHRYHLTKKGQRIVTAPARCAQCRRRCTHKNRSLIALENPRKNRSISDRVLRWTRGSQ